MLEYFPFNFEFAVCSIAGAAASVGYALAKRGRSRSASRSQTTVTILDNEKRTRPEPVQVSLKRKRDHNEEDEHDLGYPENLQAIYPPPQKRRKTPPILETSEVAGVEKKTTDVISCRSVTPEAPSAPQLLTDDHQLHQATTGNIGSPMDEDEWTVVELPADTKSEATLPEQTPLAADRSEPPQDPKPEAASHLTIPLAPALANVPVHAVESKQARPPFPQACPLSTPAMSTMVSSGGFASFAGSTSAFGLSPTATGGPKPRVRPAWFEGSPSISAFSTIEQQKLTPVPVHKTYPSGEEGESILSESKNIKLFIKRGAREFSEGITGHVKFLSNEESGAKRILIRREPLWKVSMNVRLHQELRCSFEEEQDILRIAQAEKMEQGREGQRKMEVVVYAIKPGRGCLKNSFREFARSLVDASRQLTEAAEEPTL